MDIISMACPECHQSADYDILAGYLHCRHCGHRSYPTSSAPTTLPPETAADNLRTINRVRKTIIRLGR